MKRRTQKQTSKQTNKKTNKVIFKDTHIHGDNGASFKIINDKNAPFYQYNYTDFKKWKESNNNE